MTARMVITTSPFLVFSVFIFFVLLLTVIIVQADDRGMTPPLRYRINEESPRGTLVGNLLEDAGIRSRYSADILAKLRFRFLTETNPMFEVGPTTGAIAVASPVDRDSPSLCRQKGSCELNLDVVIQPVEYFLIIKVIVEIVDINDNSPKFRELRTPLSIIEAAAVSSTYILPTATDLDSPAFGIKSYELDSPSQQFGIQVSPKLDGTLEVKLILLQRLDREERERYELKLMAIDGGRQPRTGTLVIDVLVQDSNDNKPRFDRDQYEVRVVENTPVGTVIARVHATDADVGPNGQIGYGFTSQTSSLYGHLFYIRNSTGEISIRGEIDREEAAAYQLIIIGQDHGPDPLSAEVTVFLHVTDVNDNAPTIIIHTLTGSRSSAVDSENAVRLAEVEENSPKGTFVAHVSVRDPDEGENGEVSCSLNDRDFELIAKHSTEYQIVTREMLDRERTGEYSLTLRCRDGAKVAGRLTERSLRVLVLDVNDNPPVFDQQTYRGTITENNYVGISVLQVQAQDWDQGDNGRIRYSIPDTLSVSFHIDQRGVISAHASIDREKYDSFRFPVLAVDGGSPPLTGSVLVIINVLDVNDERPKFFQSGFSFTVMEEASVGTTVGTVTAEDKDGELYNSFTFSFLSGSLTSELFTIDATTGSISTNAPLDREQMAQHQFSVLASDLRIPSLTDTASVTVTVLDRNDNHPAFIYPSGSNNTVYISNQIPIDAPVTRILVTDLDSGENARLAYSIRETNTPFRADPETGTVRVRTSLADIEFRTFRLTLIATDNGNPPLTSTALLHVNVNRSVPYRYLPSLGDEPADGNREEDETLLSAFNLVLVVGMIAGCAVVVVILVIAIAVVRQKDRHRRVDRKYNCRMEALKMLTNSESTDSSAPIKNGFAVHSSTSDCLPEAGSRTAHQLSNTTLSVGSQGSSRRSGSCKDTEIQSLIQRASGVSGRHQNHVTGSAEQGTDRDSIHSVEGSITDSGRGPSEEGEAGKHCRYLPPPPPPPRGAYWLQPRSTHSGPHSTVRFHGLSATPEEAGEVGCDSPAGSSNRQSPQSTSPPDLEGRVASPAGVSTNSLTSRGKAGKDDLVKTSCPQPNSCSGVSPWVVGTISSNVARQNAGSPNQPSSTKSSPRLGSTRKASLSRQQVAFSQSSLPRKQNSCDQLNCKPSMQDRGLTINHKQTNGNCVAEKVRAKPVIYGPNVIV